MGCTPERYRLVIGGPTRRRLDSELVATGTISEVTMRSLQRDEERTLAEWTTMFQLFIVALDPYTAQSAAVLPVAARLLREYAEADCRAAFLMACDADDARQFLGPLTDELMVFVDPDRTVTKALGLTSLPALVHVDQSPAVVTSAEGWDPTEWRTVALELSRVVGWTPPGLPYADSPGPFGGTPVDGPPATTS